MYEPKTLTAIFCINSNKIHIFEEKFYSNAK